MVVVFELALDDEYEDTDEDDDEYDDDCAPGLEVMCEAMCWLCTDFLSTTLGCLFLSGHVEVLAEGPSFQPGCDTGGLGDAERRLRPSPSLCMRVQSESLRTPPSRRLAVLMLMLLLLVLLLLLLMLMLLLLRLVDILLVSCCCCCCCENLPKVPMAFGEAEGEEELDTLSAAWAAAREVMAICRSNLCSASWMDEGALLGRWDASAATAAAWWRALSSITKEFTSSWRDASSSGSARMSKGLSCPC